MPDLLAVLGVGDDRDPGHHLVGRGVGEVGRLHRLEVGLHQRLLLHQLALLVLRVLVLGVLREVAEALGELDLADVLGHVLVDELEVLLLPEAEAAVGGKARVLALLLHLDDVLLQLGHELRHPDHGRVVGGRIPGDGGLEALEEEHLVGLRVHPEQAEHLLEPRPVAEEPAHEVLHPERLAATAALAEGDGVGEDGGKRRQLRPERKGLERADLLAVHLDVGVLELSELLDAADDERGQCRRRLGVLHEVADGLAARPHLALALLRLVVREAGDDFGNRREAELGDGGVDLRLRRVVAGEERDHRADLAGRQRGRRLDVALALPEVVAHLLRRRAGEPELDHRAGEAGVERVVNLARGGDCEDEPVADLGADRLVRLLEAALGDELAHAGEDGLGVGLVRKRGQPPLAVVLGRAGHLDRVGLAGRDDDALVAAQLGARRVPELLPVHRLHEAVGDAVVLEPHQRHRRAVGLDDALDELARLVAEQRLERRGVDLAQHQDVAVGRALEHVRRGRVGELVSAAAGEVDGDAAVEVVDLLHLAHAPGAVQDQRPDAEGDELLEPHQRGRERMLSEARAVDV